ncbi:lateral flagellar motor protein B (MotB-like) [Escherichia coli]|uniref:Lateral flagellar motor protein B (MotB-like) n=1 Tax=Escherichia coli TaxID=562 RepID=A0A377DI20_ECOLX|nr:lateral flagellar motor protein B (MotB-like) [Escherichia coli]
MFDSLDNKIIITGHTDAMAYKNNIYNNWNLSGDRALSARRVLEEAGMPEDKVMQVRRNGGPDAAGREESAKCG